jgi:hypothetical protein
MTDMSIVTLAQGVIKAALSHTLVCVHNHNLVHYFRATVIVLVRGGGLLLCPCMCCVTAYISFLYYAGGLCSRCGQ